MVTLGLLFINAGLCSPLKEMSGLSEQVGENMLEGARLPSIPDVNCTLKVDAGSPQGLNLVSETPEALTGVLPPESGPRSPR